MKPLPSPMWIFLTMYLWLALAAIAGAEAPLVIYYHERPPYLMTAPGGVVRGLTADPAAAAFSTAGVPVLWRLVPSNRQLEMIKQGGQRCAVGWFKNAERERYAKFTRPLYRDLPLVAIVREEFVTQDPVSLDRLLAIPTLKVLLKDRYSYGDYVDRLLREAQASISSTTAESITMLAMLSAHRADVVLLAAEEANYLMQPDAPQRVRLRILRLVDLPQGQLRHIMCSRDVSDDVIRRLDKGILKK